MKNYQRVLVMVTMLLFVLANFFPSWKFRVEALQVVGNDVRFLVNGTFEFSEDIIVEGNATLWVENATIKFIQSKSYDYEIRLQNPSNGYPRLIVKNAIFDSTRPFKVSLYDNSSVECDGLSFKHYLELFDFSRASVFGKSSINYIRAYGFSNVTAIGSEVLYLYAYDDSYFKVSACTVYRMYAFDNSQFDVSVSDIKYSVNAEDSSSVAMGYSSLTAEIFAKGTSSVTFLGSRLTKLTVQISDNGTVTFIGSNVAPFKFPADFSVKGFSTLNIHNSTINNALFIGYNNSTMKIEGSDISSAVVRSLESSTVNVSNSRVDWLLESEGNSQVFVVKSSFTIVSSKGSSTLFSDNCVVPLLRCLESSQILLSNSVITECSIELDSVNLTFEDFEAGLFQSLNFVAKGLNVTFLETKVEKGWNLRFFGSSNVTLLNSKLMNLGAYDSSEVWMWNSTSVGSNVKGDSKVHVWSYLTVKVVDYFGNSVEGANVTVNLSGARVESKLTGSDGVAVFELLEKFMNSTGSYHAGEYEVIVVFDVYSSGSGIKLNGSQLNVLTVQSPWWYWHVILGSIVAVCMIVGFGLFLLFKRRKR